MPYHGWDGREYEDAELDDMGRRPAKRREYPMKRLRIFDLNTPWFWLTMFWHGRHAQPVLDVQVWRPQRIRRFWCHSWQWETEPIEFGGWEADNEPA